LELIGATAIEDRLQDGVPEAIAVLLKVIIFTASFFSKNILADLFFFSPKIGGFENVGVDRR